MNNATDPRGLYLDLMKRVLTNWIYADTEKKTVPFPPALNARLIEGARARGMELVMPQPFDPEARLNGLDWPPTAHTMIGMKRLDNLQYCAEHVINNNVPGDFIETGVWRGGATIFMRAILKAYGVTERRVWVADSFEGLPPPDSTLFPRDTGSPFHTYRELAVSLEQVKSNFERYGLLDEQVQFVKGWFRDTLPAAPVTKLALVRLDGDLYESTIIALESLYPKLSIGGFLIIDEYQDIGYCRQAVDDYREQHGIAEPIIPVDANGVYWQRTR